MDARRNRWVIVAVMIAMANLTAAEGAVYRTPNFVVTAPTMEFAEQVGKAAEYYRKELAVAWLGKELKYNWYRPCPITVRVGQIGAGGATSFQFDRGEVFGWRMKVQGTEERILDSVIPHEVSHMIFASHFRRPLPRWADEGAATLIEHESERLRQMQTLDEATQYGRRFTLRQLLSIKEYPQSPQQVYALYAQGYSLADYLIEKQDRKTFLEFLETAHHHGWDNALRHHYQLKNVEQLEEKWNNWYMAGSPRLNLPQGDMVAEVEQKTEEKSIVRGQSPELGAAADVSAANEESIETAAETEPSSTESADRPQALATTDESARARAIEREAVRVAVPEKSGHSGGLDEYQLRGRKNVVAAGWEPVRATELQQAHAEAERARPPFVEETALAVQQHPPFAEDRNTGERPPFAE